MTITFNDDEIQDILVLLQRYKEITAELKTPTHAKTPSIQVAAKQNTLLKLAEELENTTISPVVVSPDFTSIRREPEPEPAKAKKTTTRKKPAAQRRLTPDETAYFRILANQKCTSTATIESLVTKFGMTQAALKSHIYRSKDLALIKGKDLPKSDIWPNATIKPTTLYIRKKV